MQDILVSENLAYVIITIAFVSVALWTFRLPLSKGEVGEKRVHQKLQKHLKESDYQLFKDLTLPYGDGGTTQVDHIVLSPFGVFVIETKNRQGWIFGGANESNWTQVVYSAKYPFQNPIHQNYKHVRVIQSLLGLKTDQLHNIVVFVGRCTPKTAMPNNVVWGAASLAMHIMAKRDILIEPDDLDTMARVLKEKSLKSNAKTRRNHIKYVQSLAVRRQRKKLKRLHANRCPLCGADSVKRFNRRTRQRFIGCSRYPACTWTKDSPN